MFDHFTAQPLPPANPLARLVDVTLRDGGFEVDFHWPDTTFAHLATALGPLGVDVVELGYLGGVPLDHGVADVGNGAYITPAMVASACRPDVRLAAMVHPTAVKSPIDLAAYAAAGLDMIRLVYHPDWFTDIARLAAQITACGMTVTVNIALASRYLPAELVEHAQKICEAMTPDVLYVADTCGAMLPDQVTALFTTLREAVGVDLGFHAHDFLTLAYANSLAAAAAGATYLDSSLLGLGRGGGNLRTELMLVRHRLPGRDVFGDPLTTLVDCWRELAAHADRTPESLVPMVCGALNLTPVEETAFRRFAAGQVLDADVAALWLASASGTLRSLRVDDLTAGWRTRRAQA